MNNQNTQNTQNSPNPPTTFLPQHGHYRNLRVYQVTEIIYDITYHFTQHYLEKGDRTVDQMIQAARSGKQNISEGNQAAATSSETEIKLTNVAKASLEELLNDYEDYLRVRNLLQWGCPTPALREDAAICAKPSDTTRLCRHYPAHECRRAGQPLHHPHPPGNVYAPQTAGHHADPLCDRRRHKRTHVPNPPKLQE